MLLSKRLVLCINATIMTFVGGSGVALACSQPACWPASFRVADNAEVPANVVALPYSVARSSLLPPGDASDPKAFRLLDDQGKVVEVEAIPDPANPIAFSIRPFEKLTPGKTYQVRYPADCTTTQSVQRNLRAGPEVTLPDTIGTVIASGHRIGSLSVNTSSGSCTTTIKAALAKVTITPSPRLSSYWPLAEVTATAEGKPALLATQQFLPNGNVEIEVYAGCGVSDPGAAMGLSPGLHSLQVQVKVAGAVALPPVATTIELRCTAPLADAGANDSGVDSGAGLSTFDAGTHDSASVVNADGGTDNELDTSSGCSCSAAPHSPARGGTTIALFALLIGYTRRRKLYPTKNT